MSWVIVTGANGGIGEATVHQLIKNGYSVFAADLAEQPIASFGTYGDALFRYRAVDVTSEESVTALANAVAALDEPITGAVLAAGIAHSQPLLETSFDTWKRLHAVNSDGVFLCLRSAACRARYSRELGLPRYHPNPHGDRRLGGGGPLRPAGCR